MLNGLIGLIGLRGSAIGLMSNDYFLEESESLFI